MFMLTKLMQAERNAKSQRVKVEKKLVFSLLSNQHEMSVGTYAHVA